jgi:magnesium-transporting ATPase (P-type)
VLTALAYLMVGDAFWKQAASPTTPPVIDRSDVLGVMVIAVLQIATVMALCFSAPLAYWQKMPPGKAIFFSFFAVLRSVRVFIVMLVAWFSMFIGATIVPLVIFGNGSMGRVVIAWLGFLFILLLQCGMYAGYRQIFGVPELAAKPPLA